MDNKKTTNQYAPDTRTRWEKFKRKMFPAKHCFTPDAPGHYVDCMVGCSVSKLDILDRIRLLITGVAVVQWKILTENAIGASEANSTFHVGTSSDLPRFADRCLEITKTDN